VQIALDGGVSATNKSYMNRSHHSDVSPPHVPAHTSSPQTHKPSAVQEPDFEEEESVPEEDDAAESKYDQDDSFIEDGEDEGYSAIDAAPSPTRRSPSPEPTLPAAAVPKTESISPKHDVRAHVFGSALAAATSAMGNSSRLDESSSFEAESPVSKPNAAAAKAYTPLEDSFVEADEQERSFEESVAEEDEEVPEVESSKGSEGHTARGTVQRSRSHSREDAKSANRSHDTEGPEYDSGPSTPRGNAGTATTVSAPQTSAESPRSSEVDSPPEKSPSRAESKESSRDPSDADEGEHSTGAGALRPARAEDFDRMDRAGPLDGAGAGGSARNRIAVRRAQLAAAGGDMEPGAHAHSGPGRANVNRLGQVTPHHSMLVRVCCHQRVTLPLCVHACRVLCRGHRRDGAPPTPTVTTTSAARATAATLVLTALPAAGLAPARIW
jgi:hypothetical protein